MSGSGSDASRHPCHSSLSLSLARCGLKVETQDDDVKMSDSFFFLFIERMILERFCKGSFDGNDTGRARETRFAPSLPFLILFYY